MLQDAHVFSGFSVNDQAAAKEFYSQKLGLTVHESGMGLNLTFKDGNEAFIYQKSDHLPATFTILNFVVDNIDTAVDDLITKGISFERYDNLPAAQDEKGILRGRNVDQGPDIAWFKDPAGNILSVLQN